MSTAKPPLQRDPGTDSDVYLRDPPLEPVQVFRRPVPLRAIEMRVHHSPLALPELEERPMDTAEVFRVGDVGVEAQVAELVAPSRPQPVELLLPGASIAAPEVAIDRGPVLSTERRGGRSAAARRASDEANQDTPLIVMGLCLVASMITLLLMLATGYGAV